MSILVWSGVGSLVATCIFVVVAPAADWSSMSKVLLPSLDNAGVVVVVVVVVVVIVVVVVVAVVPQTAISLGFS